MESKKELVEAISATLLRIMRKHAAIEELPLRFDEDVELTPREIHTLQAIGRQNGVSVTELAVYAGVTKSAASQMTAKLAEKGFLKKRHLDHNNKELRLSLTPLGQKAFNAHRRIHGKHMAEVTSRLDSFSLSQISSTAVVLKAIESIVNDRLAQLSAGKFFWNNSTDT